MSIRKILVPVQSADAAEAGLKAALVLAAAHGAHVEALHIRQRPNIPASGYYPVGVIFVAEHLPELKEAMEAEATKLKAAFDRVVGAAGAAMIEAGTRRGDERATASWRDQPGVLPSDLSAAARVADLVCFGRADDSSFPEAGFVEDVVFQSGRSVLVAPAGKLERAPRRILLAWNGRREAARALASSMPLLEEADAVSVLTIGALPADLEGPEKAAELLQLHGVKAIAHRREQELGTPEDDLVAAAREWEADLIVMGAYSHSRWRELVLGGFTRRLLKQSDFPLFLAH